ncbi:U3 snoRNP protein [Glugoides intestinalis]
MEEFIFKTAIPTASDSKGLIAKNGIYFPANTHLFKLKNSKYVLCSSCDGTILHFDVSGDYSMLCTSDRVYLNYHQNLIGSLKRSTSAIAIGTGLFAIGVNNILEVWHIPSEYSFTLFKLHSKNIGHYKTIKSIKILDEARILTASDDFTVRLFDIKRKTTKIIASLRDTPVGLHFDASTNTCFITTKKGFITVVEIESMKYQKLHYNAKLAASASFGNILAIALENLVIPKDETDSSLLPTTEKKPEKQKVSQNTRIIVFKNMEEIYNGEIQQNVFDLALENGSLFIRTAGFVGCYDLHSESFLFIHDLPKILNINIFKSTLCAGCDDGRVRIYRNNLCITTLFDEKAKGEILQAHISSNICNVVYKSGHVSSFNIADSHCFRSFSIENELLGIFSSSAVSDDGCFLFFSKQECIKVVDIVKSRLVETINFNSPIIAMKFYHDYLYVIELGKTLSKINVFSGYNENVLLEFLPTNIVIKDNLVLVSTVKEIMFYDLDLNFINAISVELEGRNRNETYCKSKSVIHIDFNSTNIFCGGAVNMVKIVEYNNSSTKSFLMKNREVQTIKVSRNKDWENYKIKLMKEKETKFDKEKVIEVLNICVNENIAYILSTDGLLIFEKNLVEFNPLEFDVEASLEFVRKAIQEKNYQKALLSAIKLKDIALIKEIAEESEDADFLARNLPKQHAQTVFEVLIYFLKQNLVNSKLLNTLNRLFYWHNISSPDFSDILMKIHKDFYSDMKKNKYLLDAIYTNKST